MSESSGTSNDIIHANRGSDVGALMFEDVYARIFDATNCRTQVELAEILSIRQSSVSDAKKRRTIPAEWLLTLLQGFGINPNWILTGLGAQFLEPTEKQPECDGADFIRTASILRAEVAVTMTCPLMVDLIRDTPEGQKYSYGHCEAKECMAWRHVRSDIGYCGRF